GRLRAAEARRGRASGTRSGCLPRPRGCVGGAKHAPLLRAARADALQGDHRARARRRARDPRERGQVPRGLRGCGSVEPARPALHEQGRPLRLHLGDLPGRWGADRLGREGEEAEHRVRGDGLPDVQLHRRAPWGIRAEGHRATAARAPGDGAGVQRGGGRLPRRGRLLARATPLPLKDGGCVAVQREVRRGIAMAALAGLVAAGPWPPAARVAAVRLGVRVVATTAQLRKTLGVERPKGALVLEVESDGPAARAGVQAGDVLTQVAGKPVGDAAEILDALAGRKAGAEVPIVYVRDREARTATVTLAPAPRRRMGLGGWWFPVPEFGEPEGLPRAWQRFQDRIERELRDLDERLRK